VRKIKIKNRSTFELFEILKYQIGKGIINEMTHEVIEELEKRFFKKELLELLKNKKGVM
jgi:hypothetical protein